MFTWYIFFYDLIPRSNIDNDGWNSWLIGGMITFGAWDFPELLLLFSASMILIAFIAKMKSSTIMESFWRGSKDMLSVAIIIVVARAVSNVGSWGWSY